MPARSWLPLLAALALAGCHRPAPAEDPKPVDPKPVDPAPVEPTPAPPEPAPPAVSTGDCDEAQAAISKQADERAAPYGVIAHLQKNFPDMKASWLLPEPAYQKFVVATGATNFGRCNDSGCFQFAAPTAVMEAALEGARTADGHDPARLGEALGLPADNMKGPLRLVTLDLAATKTCVRLPVDEDPGVWKCQSEADTDCFKFGGYTSGGLPELMVINAPVAQATVREIP